MKALVIDCATQKLAISAKSDAGTIGIVSNIGNRQSEKILPQIDYILSELNISPESLDYTAITIGPGTFTGLRLGLSTLKAITLAYNVPLYGIPSLEAYAYPYKLSEQIVLPIIKAKEDDFFYAVYSRGSLIEEPKDSSTVEIINKIKGISKEKNAKVLVCGSSSKDFLQSLNNISEAETSKMDFIAYNDNTDSCNSLFCIAESMIKDNKAPLCDYEGPIYIRKSEAEIVLDKKNSQNI